MDQPDLVISVDFGMTCTGVAYCNMSTGSDTVRHIQRWPGRTQANENKVPTLLVYPHNSDTPSSWGFLAETAQEVSGSGHESREWFKIMLDEDLLEQMRKKSSDPSKVPRIHEVEKWYTDYFQYLYRTIEARLKGELASTWENAKIEYIFSVPTTWRPLPTVERFRKIIAAAGFGSCPNHTATVGLTEAEAAAVHTARNMPGIFKENEVLFVCDVGGGTTDLSVFRVKNTIGGSLNLEQLDVVFGAAIGAAQLDTLFENAALERLELADRTIPTGLSDLHSAAWEMRISKEYQNAKCDYGSEESLADTDTFAVRVPKLDPSYTNEQFEISNGDMYFQRDDLKGIFDIQISKLFEMMDKQLVRLQQKQPNEQVAHLVLSGGLGNSPYVQSCLRSKYAFGNSVHANAQNIQIRVAPDPQLVVCKGNVADRVAKLKSGKAVLGWRCCRASYGTKCKMLYSASNKDHIGQKTEIDVLDGKAYVVDCVDWFIKKGEAVSSDSPIVRDFSRKCSPATSSVPNPPRIFPTDVICSEAEAELLPYTMNSTCRSICKVESDFATIPLSQFKLKNRHWWNSGKKYHRINFVIKVNLGPADLSFELWHNGVKLSKDNTIKVEWQAAAPPDPAQQPVDSDFPMNSLPAATNRGPVVTRKSIQHLGNLNGYGAAPQGGYQGYNNDLGNKMVVSASVTPAQQNGQKVW
ncbi:hypothetical protein C7974DRAFT_351810 [Boeremia exigua]|uniref:uncharacterized protein n=1 Tax=Boeremia exigua TaxID=749465 RepID=UPI001E8D62F8|nr:uncharacterized protein C7974DRAFT_351810 [Boeremia exigua]KAH6642853.1 hypothetical protein C7974DRAFT_351810 [Boeremia exigua]